ncbi:MAG TPA: hypothetical protein VFH23_00950 [Jiangellaceae bacterium]|nr:hypothetical protein [Jiangellaceae bacterium]
MAAIRTSNDGRQTIYRWLRKDRIDRSLEAGVSSAERAELAAAPKRIRELEAELEVHRRATELLKGAPTHKGFAAIEVMVAEGLPAQLACRVDLSESPGREGEKSMAITWELQDPLSGCLIASLAAAFA